jgi:ABC-type amino acid transport substrate-binding protein
MVEALASIVFVFIDKFAKMAKERIGKKPMKRIISITLTICLLLLALTSCGGRDKVDISGATNLEGLRGATIAAQTGTFHLDALRAQTADLEVTVQEYPDFTKLLVALNSGAIDGYVAEEPTAFSIIAQNEGLDYLHFVNNENGFTASDSDTGIAVAYKTGSPMVALTNAVIDTIDQATRSALMAQMVAISENPDTPLGEEIVLASTKTDTSKGTLKIAMECAYAPFNWSQTTDANGAVRIANSPNGLYVNGYDVQIAKYIAAELGYNLEIYEAKWEALITGVNAGTFDGIIAGMSPTAEREEEVDFTNCYYNSNLVIIYKKN